MPLCIFPREGYCFRVDVGGEDLDLRRCDRDRHANHARSRAHVRDAKMLAVDVSDRRVDEGFCRWARRKDAARRGEELESVEGSRHDRDRVPVWPVKTEQAKDAGSLDS